MLLLLPLLVLPLPGHAADDRAPWAGEILDAGSRLEVGSETRGDLLRAGVSGVIAYPFPDVAAALSVPRNWCEIAPLSMNIKACTQQAEGQEGTLTLYAGRKVYQPPEDAYRIDYRFYIAENAPDRLWLFLFAAEGPMGTSDYRIEMEAVPEGDGTRLHISSSYRSSLLSRIATSGYLATLGRNKVGFSHEEETAGEEPALVGGVRGVIERNAMRYFLALRAFLENQHLAGKERFEACLETWYDLTERYPRQLHEMEKEEYFQAKLRERKQQQRLQSLLDDRIRETITAALRPATSVD